MVVRKDSDNNLPAAKYNLNRKAGKSIIDRKPIFSPDGEYVFFTMIFLLVFLNSLPILRP